MGHPGDERGEKAEALTGEQIHQAQRVAASYATDADECRRFLSMLGIDGKGTPLCAECGDPINRAANEGCNRPGRDGMCGRCVDITDKRGKRQEVQS